MFTIEIKINGSLIGHVYGRNKGEIGNGMTRYDYEYYEPERPATHRGQVAHDPDDGIRRLVAKILRDVPERNSQAPPPR